VVRERHVDVIAPRVGRARWVPYQASQDGPGAVRTSDGIPPILVVPMASGTT
jgi:hypothetical protein